MINIPLLNLTEQELVDDITRLNKEFDDMIFDPKATDEERNKNRFLTCDYTEDILSRFLKDKEIHAKKVKKLEGQAKQWMERATKSDRQAQTAIRERLAMQNEKSTYWRFVKDIFNTDPTRLDAKAAQRLIDRAGRLMIHAN